MKLSQSLKNKLSLLPVTLIAGLSFFSSCKKDASNLSILKDTTTSLANTVFKGNGANSFVALNATTGALKWEFTGGGKFSYSNPTLVNGKIFVGGTDGSMYAIDALKGTKIWSFATNGAIESSPVVADSIVYFGSDDHNFYAVDAVTGVLKWKFSPPFNVGSSPAVANGMVFFGCADTYLYALDAKTGSFKWAYLTEGVIDQSSPVVADNTVFIGNRSGSLFAIDETTGNLKWKYTTVNNISLENTTPVVQNGLVYFTGWYNFNNFKKAGSVYAVNENTGSLVWTSLDNLGFSTGPTIADGSIYVSADDGNFYSLSAATGAVNWSKHILPNGALAAYNNGKVFISATGTAKFYALDSSNGNIAWQYTIPSASSDMSRPYITDSNVK